jgi:hypothetical protein
MKIMFKFLLFMFLFNLAAIMIAASGFFGEEVLYSDFVVRAGDSTTLRPPEDVLESLWADPVSGELPSFRIPLPFTDDSIELVVFSWTTLTIGILAVSLLIGRIMNSTPSVIAAGMVGSVFLLMFASSKKAFDQITGTLDSIVLYIALMLSVAFFFIALVTIMDYLSGQRSG